MRPRKVPKGARRLRTYAEFQSYLVDFVNGRYPFLWIVGRPGISKTESIVQHCGHQPHIFRRYRLTPSCVLPARPTQQWGLLSVGHLTRTLRTHGHLAPPSVTFAVPFVVP